MIETFDVFVNVIVGTIAVRLRSSYDVDASRFRIGVVEVLKCNTLRKSKMNQVF